MSSWNWKRCPSLLTSLALGLALLAGCQSDSPTEPSGGPITPQPPVAPISTTVTVTANPPQITTGSQTPVTITVDVRRSDGTVPPDQTPVTLTTTLGELGSLGGGQTTATLQLVNGRAQTVLFPGNSIGQATVRAEVNGFSGFTNVQIGQGATFFVASINPSVGSPQGGEEVVIQGGGFQSPVRVTFNGTAAQVLSVSSDRIRVRTPSAVAAGIPSIPVGETRPVSVSVTIRVNESGQAQDTLPNGFVYAQGGGILQPQVFSVTPSSGTNDGGTTVQILGDGFEAPVQVFFGQGTAATNFNGVEATVTSVTRTRITAITPAARGFGQNNLNQQVNILVKNLNTGFSTVGSQLYKYGSQVLITSMGPGSGPATGGTPVTIHGQGFDEPVAVSLGGVGQLVLSVTGTEIVFRTAGIAVGSCPANGIITVTGVGVTNIETGDGSTASLGFNYTVPVPIIFGVNPQGGSVGSSTVISGRDFSQNVQVLFGDATNGSSAAITNRTFGDTDTITVTVPTPPSNFTFSTEPCDGNGDGIPGGTRNTATPITVNVRNLDGTGCVATLSNAFTLSPQNTTCTGDTSTPPPPPQCSDGIDNDTDGFIDHSSVNPAGPPNGDPDPQCSSATDNNEAG